jgi:hypothetical protein
MMDGQASWSTCPAGNVKKTLKLNTVAPKPTTEGTGSRKQHIHSLQNFEGSFAKMKSKKLSGQQ